MNDRQKQILILLLDDQNNMGLGDLLDADVTGLVGLEYAKRDGQKLYITAEGKDALLAAQAAA